MGFRRFLLRGFVRVAIEWRLICLAHNLRKLVRARSACSPQLRPVGRTPATGGRDRAPTHNHSGFAPPTQLRRVLVVSRTGS
jgi:hypothetical protein